MATSPPSSLAQAADALLKAKGTTLHDWLTEQLEGGASTRVMASRLHAATDGAITPTHETIRRWLAYYDLEAAA